MSRVWDSNRQSGTDLVILLALADRASEDGVCWPSLEALAERARLADTRHVRRILRKLEQQGEIYTIPGAGRGNTSLYLVCVGMTDQEIATVLIKRCNVPMGEAMRAAEQIETLRLTPTPVPIKPDIPAQKGANSPSFVEAEKGASTREKGASTREKGARRPPGSVKNHQEPSEDDDDQHTRRSDGPPSSSGSSSSSPSPDGYATVREAYEQNIGLLTPLLSKRIKEALRTYPLEWIVLAIERAVAAEKRRWDYIEGVLRNWHAEGFTNGNQATKRENGTAGRRSAGDSRPAWANYQPAEFDAEWAAELNGDGQHDT